MSGDIFNGWPEDGEPVPRLSDRLRSCSATSESEQDRDCAKAADRLDRLEKALMDIIRLKSWWTMENTDLLADAQEIARKALDEHK